MPPSPHLSSLFALLSLSFASASPFLSTGQGVVSGLEVRGVQQFLGVPYAAPPVGALRWRAPQSPAAWKGVRQAVTFGPQCAQGQIVDLKGQEDCLTLNVYRPAGAKDTPVMVWVHGGFFTGGDSQFFDGSVLAREFGVTVVTVNYRVGVLGFMAASSVSDGNQGLMDVVQALRWVRENAGALGVDAGNVTLFGQSAGASAICSLLAAPQANGLFHKAILQSGSCTSSLFMNPLQEGQRYGDLFASSFHCHQEVFLRDCLRARSLEELQGQGFAGRSLADPVPVYPLYGTAFLPIAPLQAFKEGQFNRVPVLLGVNRDEGRVFEPFFPPFLQAKPFIYPLGLSALGVPNRKEILKQYPLRNELPVKTLARVITDGVFACPALQLAQVLSPNVPVFMYEFNDPDAPSKLKGLPANSIRGAFHGAELPYVFGTPVFEVADPAQFTSAQWGFSREVQAYWAAFARTGRPEVTGLAAWKVFTPDHPQVMTLQPGGNTMQTDFAAEHQCSFWHDLKD